MVEKSTELLSDFLLIVFLIAFTYYSCRAIFGRDPILEALFTRLDKKIGGKRKRRRELKELVEKVFPESGKFSLVYSSFPILGRHRPQMEITYVSEIRPPTWLDMEIEDHASIKIFDIYSRDLSELNKEIQGELYKLQKSDLDREKKERAKEKKWKERRKERIKRNKKLSSTRKPKLQDIAEKVFSSIDNLNIDLDTGEMRLEYRGQELSYANSFRRSYKSIEQEMRKDKLETNRPNYTYNRTRRGRSSESDDDINSVDGGPPSEAADDDG